MTAALRPGASPDPDRPASPPLLRAVPDAVPGEPQVDRAGTVQGGRPAAARLPLPVALPSVRQVVGRVNRLVAPLARSGLAGPLPVGAGLVMLRTTGRRTGLRREVPLLSLRLGHLLVVGTVRPSSQWVRNLAVDPDPAVWLGGKVRPAEATVRTGPVQVAVLDLVPGGVRNR